MRELFSDYEPMCETSEPGERLISRDEILPISLDIGRRILEVFGYQGISTIVFRLKSTKREIGEVINGEIMPSAELLLGVRRATGASIDWLLTGDGPPFVSPARSVQSMPLAVMNSHRERNSLKGPSMISQ